MFYFTRVPARLTGGGGVCLLSVLLVALLVATEPVSAMYVCRDKSGAKNFTNVPDGTSCKKIKLPPRQWSSNAPRHRRTTIVRSKVNPSQYDKEIERIGRMYRVDPRLIKAIIHTESDFNSRAVSSKGAQGLMQLMPKTARELRVTNPFNPKQNIDGGTRYFRKMLDNFNGDLVLSLAAYNAGPGLVMRTGGVPQIPETVRYINKVLRRYKWYKAAR